MSSPLPCFHCGLPVPADSRFEAQVLGAPDNGLSPLFRSYPPSPNPTRFFPALPYILSGEDPPFEQLPSTQRDLRFRVTVRDSRNLGAYSWDEAYLGVINLGGPFQVTSHSQAVTLSDATTEVRWDVAGTTSPPIAVSHVRITLSADGGETFDIVLAASTPNDGAEIVTMPFVNAANARIKVEAIGNVFFSINRAPLTLMRQGTVLRNIEWRRVGDGLQVLWRSVPGNAYRIERTATLESSDWKEAQRIVAETEESSVTLPIVTPGAAFYRVVQE